MKPASLPERPPVLPALTSLRGIAAVMVCLMHFSVAYQYQVEQWLSGFTSLLSNAYLWVDFFFLLSGFVLTHVYGEQFAEGVRPAAFGRFLWARFARIYPLHFAMLMVLVVRELVLLALFLEQNGWDGWELAALRGEAPFSGLSSLEEMLRHLLLVHSLTVDTQHVSWNSPAWSIGTEWYAYLLLPFWIALGYRPLLRARPLIIWLAMAAGVTVLEWISRQTAWQLDIAGYWGLARCIVESMMGMMAYALYRREPRIIHRSWFLVLVTGVLLVLMHLDGADALAVSLLVVLLLGCSHNRGRFAVLLTAPPLVLLGEVSYSVYMVHTPLQILLMDGWRAITGQSMGSLFGVPGSVALWLVGALLVVAVSCLTYRWIELPWRKRLRRLL